MNCATGKTERGVKLVLGVSILALGLGTGNWWGIAGVLPIVSAATGKCPARIPVRVRERLLRR